MDIRAIDEKENGDVLIPISNCVNMKGNHLLIEVGEDIHMINPYLGNF